MRLKEPLQGVKILQGMLFHHICCAIIMVFVINKNHPDNYEGHFDKEIETFYWMFFSHIMMASAQIFSLSMKKSVHSLIGEFTFINTFAFC